MFKNYAEVEFGGDFFTPTDYNDPYVQNTLLKDAFIIHALIPYSYDTIIMDLDSPAPTPPSFKHLLGTDDQARDVLARLVYGYRVSLVFGILLTLFSVLNWREFGSVSGVLWRVNGFSGAKIERDLERDPHAFFTHCDF